MTTEEKDRMQSIKELEELASTVLELKQERKLRRPLLVEFCGSPKSGKSTTITSLNLFLKRNEFKTVVLTERASVCPIKNKTHPYFNIWTLTSAIAEIVEHIEKRDVDIIICDRGIFDALCWFDWLNSNPSNGTKYLDDSGYEALTQFIKMELWRKNIDLIYVFKVNPETSIKREYANLLTDRRGSIMKESVLMSFNESIEKTYSGDHNFRKLIKIKTDTDSTSNNPNEVSFQVTKNVLGILRDYLIEKVAYFDASLVSKLKFGVNSVELIKDLQLSFGNRDEIEESHNIQPIAITVITNQERNKVLLVKKSAKRTSKDSPERDKSLLYIGGHGRKEDEKGRGDVLPTLQTSLQREIQEEIGESISVENLTPFLIYTPNSNISKKHLAVCYVIEMDLDDKKFKLTSDEFIMKTGKSKSGHILSIKEIMDDEFKNLESWSKEILVEVFGVLIKQGKLKL